MNAAAPLPDYDQPASFYLGKKYELVGRRLTEEKILYDAKDLTTHAMCVGMTGSGKTGLCLALLEEAALDGIPAICIDPKGDLGNLLLSFPDLAAKDFAPWLEESEASRKGMTPEQYAQETAEKWKAGLASWDQQPERIQRFRDAVDVNIYTPASNAGIPLTVLKNFEAPPRQVAEDNELMRERVAGASAGLLTLLGLEADPLTSREHILLSTIFDNLWRKGQNLDLAALIRAIQAPPVDKIGVFDLESFFPSSDRIKFAMGLNNLLASPTFAGWLEGEPLDIRRLLYTAEGKPRLSILSIAHLNDSERMFFVTMLLNELLAWVRTQPGTSTLRALFYMDEVYGYFPPSAKPPSKPPMLVLLKQARAFGLGIILATQNPVDLDYKGLSNIGTWFLGRLQTARDKDRVLDGLEGAAAQTGTPFNRSAMEQTLAGLGSRVFLMNNVHDDEPTIFQSRWAMSFLRGPLSRDQIQTLMSPKRLLSSSHADAAKPAMEAQVEPVVSSTPKASRPSLAASLTAGLPPIVPVDVDQRYCLAELRPAPNTKLLYRPALFAQVAVHYVRASANLDYWTDKRLVVPAWQKWNGDIWDASITLARPLDLTLEPDQQFQFEDPPSEMLNARSYKSWQKSVGDFIYRHRPLTLFNSPELKTFSQPGQDELDARMSWELVLRERRDEAKEQLQAKYAKLQSALESKIRTAEQRLAREQAQFDQEKYKTALDVGQTVLGWLVGKKVAARGATAGRGLGRAVQQRTDVQQAADSLDDLLAEKRTIVEQCERDIQELKEQYSIHTLDVETLEIPCRKGDLQVNLLALLWVPFQVAADGTRSPLVKLGVQGAGQQGAGQQGAGRQGAGH